MRERRQQNIWDTRVRQTHASVFGVFRLKDKDGLEIIIPNRRARAVLAMLCLVPDEPLERDFVSCLLWPGRFKAQAKSAETAGAAESRPPRSGVSNSVWRPSQGHQNPLFNVTGCRQQHPARTARSRNWDGFRETFS